MCLAAWNDAPPWWPKSSLAIFSPEALLARLGDQSLMVIMVLTLQPLVGMKQRCSTSKGKKHNKKIHQPSPAKEKDGWRVTTSTSCNWGSQVFKAGSCSSKGMNRGSLGAGRSRASSGCRRCCLQRLARDLSIGGIRDPEMILSETRGILRYSGIPAISGRILMLCLSPILKLKCKICCNTSKWHIRWCWQAKVANALCGFVGSAQCICWDKQIQGTPSREC